MLIKYFLLLVSFNLFAQDPLSIIAVGEAEVAREKLVVSYGASVGAIAKKETQQGIFKQVSDNFNFYKKRFEVVGGSELTTDSVIVKDNYSGKKSSGIQYTINIFFKGTGIEFAVHNIFEEKRVYYKKFDFKGKAKIQRADIHKLSDEMYFAITGKESIFKSKIVFVSDIPSTKSTTIKELYIADFDGKNTRRLTYHKGIVISPSLNKKGDKVLYSLIRYVKGKRNVNLRIMDLGSGSSRIISKKKGINSGAIFANDEDYIYLTLSHRGNADIYKKNLKTGKLLQITSHSSDDVDPSINKKGDILAFLSGRPGKATIYTAAANSREKRVKRISYVGRFNATPRFNPEGTEMAFSSWVDNRFDIYRINTEGTELVRLTKNFGSNESPSYSLDGQFIVFSSQRVISQKKAVQNLYIMDRDGEILGNITENFGNCLTPRWSK